MGTTRSPVRNPKPRLEPDASPVESSSDSLDAETADHALLLLSRRRVRGILARMVVLLSLASACVHVLRLWPGVEVPYGVQRILRVDVENSLPTWFASTLLLVSAVLLFHIGSRRYLPRALGWNALGWIFLALAIDETASFHEILIGPVRRAFDLGGALHFAWVVPGALVTLVLALAYRGFLLALPRATRRGFVLAAIVYLGGALGMELVGGLLYSGGGFDSAGYVLASSVEEVLEMAGLVLFVDALLGFSCNRRLASTVRIMD